MVTEFVHHAFEPRRDHGHCDGGLDWRAIALSIFRPPAARASMRTSDRQVSCNMPLHELARVRKVEPIGGFPAAGPNCDDGVVGHSTRAQGLEQRGGHAVDLTLLRPSGPSVSLEWETRDEAPGEDKAELELDFGLSQKNEIRQAPGGLRRARSGLRRQRGCDVNRVAPYARSGGQGRHST